MRLPWSSRCESRDLLASSSYIEEFIAAVHVSLTTAKEFAGAVICHLFFFLVFQLKEFKHTQLDFVLLICDTTEKQRNDRSVGGCG